MSNIGFKKTGIISLFGQKHGQELMNFLSNCCGTFGTICDSIKTCLGISSEGNSSLFLNQQGNWVNGSGMRTENVTLFDTHNRPNYSFDHIPDGVIFQIYRDFANGPGLFLVIPPNYSYDDVNHILTFNDPVVPGETLYFYYSY